MFSLTPTTAFALSPPGSVYLYDVLLVGSGVATIASDNVLRLLNPLALQSLPLAVVPSIHDEATCLRALEAENSVVSTAGRDGQVKIFDLRLSPATAKIQQFDGGSGTPILSLACRASAFAIATGTELANSQAMVAIWDTRHLGRPRAQYVESHSDDVTELTFHPSNASALLSGSTDGLVNVYNTDIADEEDALHQTINHGASIHRAGFLSATDIYALSHDEKFSTYEVVLDPDDSVKPRCQEFGDLRERLGCEYVANVVPRPHGGAVIGAGTHSQNKFDLVHLEKDTWRLGMDSIVTLPGAHSDEVVRSFCFLDEYQMIVTAGEDSQVKAWGGAA